MQTDLLKTVDICDTMEKQTHVLVERRELEQEHTSLLARLHQLRRLLGYPPLMTGKMRRAVRGGE